MADVQTRLTAAAFLALPETNLPTELLDGELIQMPSPDVRHQRGIGHLFVLLRGLVPDGEVFVAPLDVVLDEDNVVQPDVMWVAGESRCQITDQRLIGAPDLIVEILSPGTARHDRRIKFRLYERHGVREYWIVDLLLPLFEVWQWVEGRFVLVDVCGPEDTLQSPLLGSLAAAHVFGG